MTVNRTPVWGTGPPKNSWIVRQALRPYPYSWPAAIFQIFFVSVISYYLRSLPAPGIAVAFLGFAAVIMAVRGSGFTSTEEIAWICIAFALCWIEIRAIQNDHVIQEARHNQELVEERSSFRNLLIQDQRGFFTVSTLPAQLQKAIKREEETGKLLADLSQIFGPEKAKYELKARAATLSKDILQLLLSRQAAAPPFPLESGDLSNDPNYRKAVDYMLETLSQYRQKFSHQVIQVHDELKMYGLDTTNLDKYYNRPVTLAYVSSTASEIGRLADRL